MTARRILLAVFCSLSFARVAALDDASDGLPTFEKRNERVLLSDGVGLSTDIYLPLRQGPFPTLLLRTPYGKGGALRQASYFTAHGYAVVAQDCRGRGDSGGEFYLYINEGRDGFETQEWVGQQPWCSGDVGTFGASYVGATQWLAAPFASRHVKVMAPVATFTNFYGNLYLGGALRVGLIGRWAASMTAPSRDAFNAIDFHRAFLHLPLHEMDEEFGWRIPMLRDMVFHADFGAYWQSFNVEDRLSDVDVPALHMVGLYDFFLPEVIKSYQMMVRFAKTDHARRNQRLVIGSGPHAAVSRQRVGEMDFGPEAEFDANGELRRWFDRHLKGIDNGVDREPPIRYFVMGLNRWRECHQWPPRTTRWVDYFLTSREGANTAAGDGSLQLTPPANSGTDRFVADPADPIPAKGGRDAAPTYLDAWEPFDQRAIEQHPEVLVYTSPPLDEDVEVVGPVRATLYVETDAPDTDVVAKLVDVHPDGFAQNLATGILRGRYRHSASQPHPLTPHKIHEWTIDLTHVSNRFLKGHRIRLDIAGSCFPLYDRNPNNGGDPQSRKSFVATQKLHHSPQHRSRLTLSVSTIR